MEYPFRLDHDFVTCLVPLSEEEYAQLEKNILDDGEIREPLILWRDWVIDGMHRLKIARKHNLPVKTVVKEFPSKEAAKLWVLMHQLGRRNLTPDMMALLRGRLFNASVASGHGYRKTVAILAKQTGTSANVIKRDGLLAKQVDSMPESVRDSIQSGAVKVTRNEAKTLASLPSEAQEMIVGVISEGGAKSVNEVIEKAHIPVPPKPEGVPEILHPVWRDKAAIVGFMQAAGKLLNDIERFAESSRAGYYLDAVAARADLKNVSENLRVSMPWKVCVCRGNGCDKCNRLGWLTREQAAGMKQ